MSESVPTPAADDEATQPSVDQKTLDFIQASLKRYLTRSDITVSQAGSTLETTHPEAADQVHPPAA